MYEAVLKTPEAISYVLYKRWSRMGSDGAWCRRGAYRGVRIYVGLPI